MRNNTIILSPISRLTICFSVGIFFSDRVLRCHNYLFCQIVVLIVIALVALLVYRSRKCATLIFPLLSFLFFFLCGSLLTNWTWINISHTWNRCDTTYIGRIEGKIEDRGKYKEFIVDVGGNHVLTRAMNDSLGITFESGQRVCMYGKINPPGNRGNPFEFDYATYLLHNKINGVILLGHDEIKAIGSKTSASLYDKSMEVRDSVVSIFKRWGIASDELALLSALTVGERDMLSQQRKDDYIKSGLSHLLSISGMHVGVILLIANLFLWPMKRNRYLRIVRLAIITIALWAFAFISGLPSSAVRAVIMCLFFELTSFSSEKRNPLNILSLTALCMLVYNPFYLFDIGFQISFAAVAAIILFYTPLMNLMRTRYKIVNGLMSIIAISLSAQIGAAPLVLFYFSNFSLYFLISNILSSYLIIAIMATTVLSLILPFLPLHSILLILLETQNGISTLVASFPFSSLEYHRFPFINILIIYALSLAVLYYIYSNHHKYSIRASVLLLIFLSYNFIYSIPSKMPPHIMLYNDTNMAYVHLIKNRSESFIVTALEDTLNVNPRASVMRYCDACNMSKPIVVSDCRTKELYAYDGIVQWRGKRFCILCDNRWRQRYTNGKELELDFVYINRGFYGSLSSLRELFIVKRVVLGYSLGEELANSLREECIEYGIPFVDLRQRGYYKIMV